MADESTVVGGTEPAPEAMEPQQPQQRQMTALEIVLTNQRNNAMQALAMKDADCLMLAQALQDLQKEVEGLKAQLANRHERRKAAKGK